MMMSDLTVITPDWHVPDNVVAFSTTTFGGVSTGSWQGLNLGQHVGDNPHHVADNRNRLQQHVGQAVSVCWLAQVHGDDIADLADYSADTAPMTADAAVTDLANKAAIVMTADCLPVLICRDDGSKVAALHCGWQGLYKNLIAKTLAQHFQATEVQVWLGPAIAQQSYEVDEALYQRFITQNSDYQRAFSAHRKGHYLMDLYHIAKQQLTHVGVPENAIFGGGFDTFSDPRFYSHRQHPKSGRQATLIYLK